MPEQQKAKIGVFLCHCGKNIGATVDIPRLKKELEEAYPDLVVKEEMFLCSEGGQLCRAVCTGLCSQRSELCSSGFGTLCSRLCCSGSPL